ncbi:unnamed protein product, partial [Candidula unifasciata]
MSSYFVNSLSACYGSGPAGLDPCTENISGYDRNPAHHHHQQQQHHHGSNVYSPAVYGNSRYSNYHHARLNSEARYADSIHSEYYSVPRLSHLPPSSPSPPPLQTNISCASSCSPPSSSPQLCDRKHVSSVCGTAEYRSNTSSTPSNLSTPSALQNVSNTGTNNQNSSGTNNGEPGYYTTPGINNFLDDNKTSCDSPPLSQRQKLPQPAHQQPAAAPSSPQSPSTKQQLQQQRQNEKGGSPNSQSDQGEGSFPAPQIYPWMRRMQYSA